MSNKNIKNNFLLNSFYLEKNKILKQKYVNEIKDFAKTACIKKIRKEGLKKSSFIVKLALQLIDKTDGKLSLKDIIRMEKQGFGLVLVHQNYSLTDKMEFLDENIMNTSITNLIETLGQETLNLLAENVADDDADELLIMGSKEGYIVADIYLDEKSAYVHDLTGDKSSPKYNSGSSSSIFLSFLNYCNQKGIKEIHLEARESTTDKILKRMKETHEQSLIRGAPLPSPLDKIKEIQRGEVEHTLETKFSQGAKDLLFSYSKISSNLLKIYLDDADTNISAQDAFNTIDNQGSINKINNILQDEEILNSYNELKNKIIDELNEGEGESLIEDFLKNLNQKINSYLESFNVYDEDGDLTNSHFTDENYYNYVIYLS